MTYPRAHLVDEQNGGYYHCTSRCVRRAWLCGKDPVSGSSYDHRKGWLEARILKLANYFAIDVYAYAVMSNHYHMVVRSCPKRTIGWSAEDVAARWLGRHGSTSRSRMKEQIADLVAQPSRISVLRERLGSLSWFMRCINEPMARIANAEDDCTGRFWEGRFKSVALLDRSAIINCMVYVELNPARAKPRVPVPSGHTSALIRTQARRPRLAPLGDLDLTLSSYLKLIEWTNSNTEKRAIKAEPPHDVLAELGLSPHQWLKNLQAHAAWYRAYGLPASIEKYVQKLKQRWIQMPALRAPVQDAPELT